MARVVSLGKRGGGVNKEMELSTRMVRGGKKSGTSIASMPWYFLARSESKVPYFALAGSVHGGLFPLPTFTPPRKMGIKLSVVSVVEP